MNSVHRLNIWSKQNGPVRVAIVGAGFVGKGLLHRFSKLESISTPLLINRSVDNALGAYAVSGVDPASVIVSDDIEVLTKAINDGQPAVAQDAGVLTELENIDVVFEATGALNYGAEVVLTALRSGKHVASMNAELDATIGHLLHKVAKDNGVVYTIGDGDQPGVILRQLQFVQGMGMKAVAAINCKRYLNPHQSPDDSKGFASRDDNSTLMATAFGDGTKMNIEQVVLSNLTGMIPAKRGMHGVATTLEHAANDIMSAVGTNEGVVEYTIGGDFGAGIGVIGYSEGEEMEAQPLRNFKMGDGPYYFFFRPYHLVHFEAPFTIADIMLDQLPLGTPTDRRISECVSLAKRDLKAGISLDGIGGATCYGQIDTAENSADLLPVGLCAYATLRRATKQDHPISLADVELNEDAYIVKQRKLQDKLFG